MSETFQMPKKSQKTSDQELKTGSATQENSSNLLWFAVLALEVSVRMMRFQPKSGTPLLSEAQAIAILCLMCREGWSSSQTHARLAANAGLCAALKLDSLPDSASFCRFMQQCGSEKANIAMLHTVQRILGHGNSARPVSDRSA